jgi:V/A-type H+-transporting ATPase subunit A
VRVYEYTGGLRQASLSRRAEGHFRQAGPQSPGRCLRRHAAAARASASSRVGARPATLLRSAWQFARARRRGLVDGGAVLGRVRRQPGHRPLVPPDVAGTVEWVAPAREYRVHEPIARVDGRELALSHHWPVRRPRPVLARLHAAQPLVTGQRVLDLLYPLARGSTAAVPGGFGTGKTVLSRWRSGATRT